MPTITPDYEERVYAGVLGKIIGVYLGRPFEGWSYERLTDRFGEVDYYVHEQLGAPLIVTDDDISGTFTFLRALPDYGNRRDLSPRDIGQTWLNYIIEGKSILWWGGMGNSTEHTAYYRLKSGIEAPRSGSIALNGKTVAEQIGAQIFIDGWGMVSPGDPEMAADLAGRAASVSHDGEAVYGAQVVAALEAQAFVESDLNRLLDTASSLIPGDSVIYRLIADLREWRAAEPDWRRTRERIVAHYGYDKYGGNCHMVPNHALILLGLLYGDDDFQRTLMITNTSGWDTDCNSGNVGCIMGIKKGLAGLETGPDWRGPVADRMYLPTADGGRAITDAAREALEIASMGRALAGDPRPAPKEGARYHFSLPGSVQGFLTDESPECRGVATVENHACGDGVRRLMVRFQALAKGRCARAGTATFIPPSALQLGGYSLTACPTLYAGQRLRARIRTCKGNPGPVEVGLYLKLYGPKDELEIRRGPKQSVEPGSEATFEWKVEPTGGYPIAEVGIEVTSEERADGKVLLDTLTWDGAPEVSFPKPEAGTLWRRAWVQGCDHFDSWEAARPYRVMQDEGTGLLLQGTREWAGYELSAEVTPRLLRRGGLAVCVQGLKRWVALLLCDDGKVRLVKALDGERVLAEADFDWKLDETYRLALGTRGSRYSASIDGRTVLEAEDRDRPLESGAAAFVCEVGRMDCGAVAVRPLGD